MKEKTINIPSFMTQPGFGTEPIAPPTAVRPRAKPAPLRNGNQPLADTSVKSLVTAHTTERWRLEQLHVADHHRLYWTTRGQGRALLDGRRCGFGAHNAIFVPADAVFAIELGPHVQGFETRIPNDGRVQLPTGCHLVRFKDGMEHSEFTSIFDAMRRETQNQRPLMTEALAAHANLLSIGLRRAIANDTAQSRLPAKERLAKSFCALLALQFTSGQPMAWYAAELGITPTHLTRVCRQSAGFTAAEMLSQMVQHRTRSLLIESDLPIKRISDAMGFGSAAYFTRFCQQHFGAAPSKLRKQARGL
ncbi:helix-turn-helix transcriptional regulator [Shimia sp. MMG029]|nr:helix-turn-helix transcriptional regulator [Shimia sp. MMG029]